MTKLIAALAILFACPAFGEWRFSSTKDAMTDETVKVAVSSSDQLVAAIFRSKDGKAWMSLRIPDASSDMFEPSTSISLRVDDNPHQEYKRLPPLRIPGIPDAVTFNWRPKAVSFLIWHGNDSQGRAKILEQMMAGKSLLVRYISTGGNVRDVRLDLANAAGAITQSLEIPLVQSAQDRESMERWRYSTEVFNSCGRNLDCMKAARACPVPDVAMDVLKACLEAATARYR